MQHLDYEMIFLNIKQNAVFKVNVNKNKIF